MLLESLPSCSVSALSAKSICKATRGSGGLGWLLQLLGMNVADARRSCAPGGRWGVPVMRHIGGLMLDAIAGMHALGYIHRDVKPANFAITPRHATPAEGACATSGAVQLVSSVRLRRPALRGRCLQPLSARGPCAVAGAWHVIDFGLARKFTSHDGSVIAARDKKEFRGSTSYASLAAHQLEDLGEAPGVREGGGGLWLHLLVPRLVSRHGRS